MNSLKSRVLPVVLGAAVVVGAANLTAYAADGHAFLLGGHNTESRTSTLATTGTGPALSLTTSGRSAPLKVNGSGLVAHLNADRLDGKHAAALASQVRTFRIAGGTAVPFRLLLTKVPNGRYLASYDVVMNVTGGPGPSICYLRVNDHQTVLGYGPYNHATFTADSASGLVQVTRHRPVSLICDNGDTGDTVFSGPGYPSSVTLLRVDAAVGGKTKPARNREGSGPGR